MIYTGQMSSGITTGIRKVIPTVFCSGQPRLKQWLSNSWAQGSDPFTFLKIIVNSKELLFMWVISIIATLVTDI